ncbi:MAG: metallophosphoesterase [Fimbriimonadaceae bacterium]
MISGFAGTPSGVSLFVLQMARSKLTRRQFLVRSVMFGAGLAAVDAFGVEPRFLVRKRTEIAIKGLGAEFDGYRIALLSDFHLPSKSSKSLVQRACAMAMDFRPDLVALPGDFVHKRDTGVSDFSGYFDQLSAPDGVWATLGNHDHWVDAEAVKEELATNTPIKLIEHKHTLISRGDNRLAVGGVGDLWCGYVNPSTTFRGLSQDVPRILLSHNPDLAENLHSDERIDLQLSGHTHGGEIRFAFTDAPIIPSQYGNKFRSGLCQGKRHRVYVTRGVCTVFGRFFCPPEVSELILRVGK